MAVATQPNFEIFTYVDDNAATWNKRGELETAVNAIDGSTALTAGVRVWPSESRRFHTRKVVFRDPTTFRTKRIVVYTPAAFAALTSASTLAVAIQGQAGTITYNLIGKIPERQPQAATTVKKADHP
jgi:hypothetical protein